MNGHNPLAGMAYVLLYGLFALSILSGLGLFAWVSRIPAWRTLFGWTWSVLPIEQLRLLHFLLMFLFIGFAIHHVYSSVLFDLEERNGELSSIITGYKADVPDGETAQGTKDEDEESDDDDDTGSGRPPRSGLPRDDPPRAPE